MKFFFVTDVDFLAFTASRAFELAYSVIVLLCSRCVSHFYSVFYLQSFISFFEQLSQFFYRGKHLQACAPQKKVGLLLRPDTSSTIKANCFLQIFAKCLSLFSNASHFVSTLWLGIEYNLFHSPFCYVLEWSRKVSPNHCVAHLKWDEGRFNVVDFG